jgi:hypothetical protein
MLTTVFDIVFAAGIALVVAALTGAVLRLVPRTALVVGAALELGAAAGAWIALALESRRNAELAVAAAGLTVCTIAAASALLLERALMRAAAQDAHLEEAQTRLRALVDREAEERAAELERTLARARADSTSLLSEEERRIADEHRREFAQRERDFAAALTESLTAIQSQVEQRLAGWAQDLDRAAEVTKAHIAELAQRQKRLLSEVELRVAADADRLATESDEQRAALQRLRTELETTIEDTLAAATTEVESLGELDERLRRRERELLELIEREEVEVAARIRAGFDDVQRRQIEQMERIVERAAATYSDDAAQQFAGLVKSSREDAARRLARELERAVEVFAREAESVLAERLAHVGDAGAQRLERRLAEATSALEQRRDERLLALDGRVAELEADIRRRLDELGADTDAERAVIEARLQDLLRRAGSADALQSS